MGRGDRGRHLDQADDNRVYRTAVAATVSYLHMHALVKLHGQPGWGRR
jgi:hypothetical protein